jgi:general secretion pathway protein D
MVGRGMVPAITMTIAACSSLPDSAPMTNTWGTASLKGNTTPIVQSAPASGTPLTADRTPARATYIEGTGRFVGSAPVRALPEGSSDEGITLNLVNVPTAQAAKTVLGDIMAVHYIVDPAIEGKVTIQTPRPVPRSEILDLFQSALSANNATITNVGGMYKIVPAEQAAIGAKLAIGNLAPERTELGSGVQIVPLKFVSANEMRRILEPLAPRGGIIQADPARNTLTLSGTSQDIAGMLEAISVFDVDVMKGMSFATVPVKTSQPTVIAAELEKVFATGEEGPMAGMVRFLPNKRLGAVLIISPQPRYLARAEGWVRHLDAQAAGKEKQFYTYRVQNRRAQELVEVLKSIFSSEGASAQTTRNVTPRSDEALLSSASSQTSSKSTSGFRSGRSSANSLGSSSDQGTNGFDRENASSTEPQGANGGSAQIALGEAENGERPAIKVVADAAKNAILVEATPADYQRVLRVIETLDVMPNQVLIEATIVEVGLKDNLKFGLRWFMKDNASSFTFSDDKTGAVGAIFPGFSYALKAANVMASLNALNEITDVNVISSPSLTVMDNKTATLQIGDQVPITTQSAVSVTDPDAPIVNSVSYKDTGVILSMTPRINESGRVLIDIEQEVSSVVNTSTSGIDSPTIRQRRVKTTVMVNDGEAIALGGLIQTNKTKGRSQIPIVGDIPILGNAFKQKDDQSEKTELIILITPRVMRNLEEARQVTEEYKREFASQVWKDRQGRTLEKAARRTFD